MENEHDTEELMEAVAAGLSRFGLRASADDTGGGIVCVVVARANGGEISWGTADLNWGATVTDGDGNVESSIATECPSDTRDVELIVSALHRPSLNAGAQRE